MDKECVYVYCLFLCTYVHCVLVLEVKVDIVHNMAQVINIMIINNSKQNYIESI